jgi:hypothetical protein
MLQVQELWAQASTPPTQHLELAQVLEASQRQFSKDVVDVHLQAIDSTP